MTTASVITTSNLEFFAQGTRRECYIHPSHPDRCIKIWRRGFEPHTLRQQASFFRRLRKPLSAFDENLYDWSHLTKLEKHENPDIWKHLPRCHGFEETDRGPGLVVDLVRDYNGLISRSLYDRLWKEGYLEKYKSAFNEFADFWSSNTIPTRTLQLHNLACQEIEPDKFRLVLVDGFGSITFIPIGRVSQKLARRDNTRRINQLREGITNFVPLSGDQGLLYKR